MIDIVDECFYNEPSFELIEILIMKISKKQAMLNTLICDMIVAMHDYNDKRITKETLEYLYKRINSFVVCHLDQNAFREFREQHAVIAVKQILELA